MAAGVVPDERAWFAMEFLDVDPMVDVDSIPWGIDSGASQP
ncbi:MAG: hypothetical protein AB7T19_19465 [Planctomycetota bacterium]